MKFYSFINIFICIIINVNFFKCYVNEFHSINSVNLQKRSSTCKPVLKLKGCNTKKVDDPRWNWKKNHVFNIECKTEGSCVSSHFSYEWLVKERLSGKIIKKYPEFNQKPFFKFKQFALEPGKYTLLVTVTETAGGKTGSSTADCWITFKTEPPIPLIAGGSLRTVPSNLQFLVNGTVSVNMDAPPTANASLYYEWGCKEEPKNKFCRDDFGTISLDNVVKVPASYAKDGAVFEFQLRISYKPPAKYFAVQKIEVKDNAPSIEIICEKNCETTGSKANIHLATFVKAFCIENCKGITSKSYSWSVTKNSLDLDTQTQFGSKINKLVIKENALKPGETYEFTVSVSGNSAKASVELSVNSIPNGGTCSIDPKEGESFSTIFTISCKDFKHTEPIIYQIYQQANDVSGFGVLLAFDSESSFKLPLSGGNPAKITVKLTDIDGIYNTISLSANVKLSTQGINDIDERIKKISRAIEGHDVAFESLSALVKESDFESATQVSSLLVEEVIDLASINNIKVKTFIKQFSLDIIKEISKLAINDNMQFDQIASLFEKLLQLSESPADAELGKASTELCKKLSELQVKSTAKARYPTLKASEVKVMSQRLFVCAEANISPNFEDIKPDPPFEFTTPAIMVSEPIIPENYPNYGDLDVLSNAKLKRYQENSENAIDTLTAAGVAIGNTLVPGEIDVKITKPPENNILYVQTDQPNEFRKNPFKRDGILIRPSKQFVDMKKPVTLVISVHKSNPFWWSPDSQNISTPVINVNFFRHSSSGKKVTSKHPMDILLKVKAKSFSVTDASVTVPTDFKMWNSETLDDKLTVHRIDIKNRQSLQILFHNLNEPDKLRLVVTNAKRPVFDDFKDATILPNNNSFFLNVEKLTVERDTWFYVAILPDKEMINFADGSEFTLHYSVSFISISCLNWNVSKHCWDTSVCTAGSKTTLKQIHCRCKHQTAFTGMMADCPNKLDPIREVPNEMEIQMNYTIFIFVYVVWTLYCIFIIIAAILDRKFLLKERIFFLSDNLQNERYAYLIVVKTGSLLFSGTTSNISIKIRGDQCVTRGHLLNYPDSEKKMLQKHSEIGFVLATERHLGDLKYIDIWFDSVGLYSTWYCEYIIIYDLQFEGEWYFNTNKWFTVLKDGQHFYRIESNKERIHEKRKHRLYSYVVEHLSDHSWNILNWSRNDSLSYFKRCTILLSVILCTFTLTMLFYGIPHLRMADGFDYGHYAIYGSTIFIAIASSLISFLLNLGFITLFKYSAKTDRQVSVPWKKRQLCTCSMTTLSWVLLSMTIITTLTILIIFGFWVPRISGWLWISSIAGAIIQKKTDRYVIKMNRRQKGDLIEDAENQRFRIYQKFGPVGLRPYLRRYYRPMNKEQVKEKRMRELARMEIIELIQDLIMFSIYIVVLFIVVTAHKDTYINVCNNEIKNIFVVNTDTENSTYESIETVQGIYDFLNHTFIRLLHSITWYEGWSLNDPGITADFATKLIGVARLRQLRICENCCIVPDAMRKLNLSCSPEFASKYSLKEDETWAEHLEFVPARVNNSWKYQSASETGTSSIYGEISVYTGGGFVTNMGRTFYNSHYILKYLADEEWIDERTRALFIEFLLYNANYNIFHSVRLIIERSAAGLFIKSHSIVSERLLFVNLEMEKMTAVSFGVFILVLVMYVFKHVWYAVKRRKRHFKMIWNIVDFVLVGLSFICIVLTGYKTMLVGELLNELESAKHNKFISYFHLIRLEEAFTILAAVLVCLATVRLWKLLRFAVMFRIMEKTLLLSVGPLAGTACLQFIVTLMFSLCGYIFYGPYSESFKDILEAVTTLTRLSLNLNHKFDFTIFETIHSGIGYYYYTLFMLITLVMYTIYVCIIIISYAESQLIFSNVKRFYTIQDFIREEFHYICDYWNKKLKNLRLRGGGDIEIDKVTPKAPEHRYAEALTISCKKISTMEHVTRCVLKTMHKTTLANEDFKLMKKTACLLLDETEQDQEKEIFFVHKDFSGKGKLVHDEQINRMVEITNRILNQCRENEEYSDEEEENFFIPGGSESRIEYFQLLLDRILKIFNNITFADAE